MISILFCIVFQSASPFFTIIRQTRFPNCACPYKIYDIYPAYGIYISQLIRYSRTCGSYQDFLDRGLLLTRKLLTQGFLLVKLKCSQWENLNHLFCRKISFLTALHCLFRGVGQGMKRTYLYRWYPLFQAQ
jgi:hypothetical protein